MIDQVWIDKNFDGIVVGLIGTVVGGVILTLLMLAIKKIPSLKLNKRIPAFIIKILNMKLVEILVFIATYVIPLILFVILLIEYFNTVPTIPVVLLMIFVCSLALAAGILKLVIMINESTRERIARNFKTNLTQINLLNQKIKELEAKLNNKNKLS